MIISFHCRIMCATIVRSSTRILIYFLSYVATIVSKFLVLQHVLKYDAQLKFFSDVVCMYALLNEYDYK